MPGQKCAVATCKNNLQGTGQQNSCVSYHSFPKETKLRTLWINACRRTDAWNPKRHSAICSVHFKDDDFHFDLSRQPIKAKTKRSLKRGSVPSLLLEAEDEWLSGFRSIKARRAYGSKNKKIFVNFGVFSGGTVEQRNEKVIVAKTIENLISPTVDHQNRFGFLRIKDNLLKQSFHEELEKENSKGKTENDYAKVSDGDDFKAGVVKVEPEPTETVYLVQPDRTYSAFSNIKSETLARDCKCHISDRNIEVERNDVESRDGQSEYKCDICNKSDELELPHKCDVYTESCEMKDDTVPHMDCYMADRIHKCNVCLKGFKVKRRLATHMANHTRDGNRKCEFCGRHFNSSREMLRHMGQLHETCDVCCRRFKTKDEVGRHMEQHRESNLKCSLCGRIFALKSSLKRRIEQNCRKLFGTSPKNANLLEVEVQSPMEEDKVGIKEENFEMDVAVDALEDTALEDKPSLTANETHILVTVMKEYPEPPEPFNLWQMFNNETTIKEEEN